MSDAPEFEQAVYERMRSMQIASEAKKRLAVLEAEQRNEPLPSLTPLTDFLLAEADDDAEPIIRGLLNRGERALLVGPAKAGKTTLRGNIIKSVVDGGAFLGTFPVSTVSRAVVIDAELSPRQLKSWTNDLGIRNQGAVSLVSLRGRANAFDVRDEAIRAHWVSQIGDADVLVVDCLGPFLRALGLNPDREAGIFLDALDHLMREAGIGSLILLHHMGHSGERSRGDSVIVDWPDSTWKVVRESSEADDSPRYFSAFGRDVDVNEGRLDFEKATRSLTLTGVNRRETRAADAASELQPDVLAYVAGNPGCSKHSVELGVAGANAAKRMALNALLSSGAIEQRPRVGKGGGVALFAATSPTSPKPRLDEVGTSPTSPIRREAAKFELPAENPRRSSPHLTLVEGGEF